jgi:hypothetical protein
VLPLQRTLRCPAEELAMANNQTIQVDISWREIPILSDVTLEVEEEGAFLPTSSPMPVGTMLVVTPVRNREVRVSARIEQIREAATSASQRGMRMVFEAAWEQLQEYADQGAAESAESEPDAESEPEPESSAEASEVSSFDEESVPAGPPLSQNSGEYIEIVTISSPSSETDETEDQDVKDSGLAPQASGEIQLGNGAQGGDPEAPDKVIVDVTDVPAPRPEATAAAEEDEQDLAADPSEEVETSVERPSGLRAAEEEDDEAEEAEEQGKKRKRKRGRGKRRKKKR